MEVDLPALQRGTTDEAGATVPCCSRCSEASSWTYRLNGDGDGIEFLEEIALLHDGSCRTTTVVLSFTH